MFNSYTSFNYLIDDIVGDASTAIGIAPRVPVEYQINQVTLYPSVRVTYLLMGAWSAQQQKHYHQIQISVFTNNSDDKTAIRLAQEIETRLGFRTTNTLQAVTVKKRDYYRWLYVDTSLTEAPVLGRMRLALADRDGWRLQPDDDQNVRHLALRLMLTFKIDAPALSLPLFPP